MALYLGNLEIPEIENRAGVRFPDQLVEYMKPRHQTEANNIKPEKWHCFDIPFVLLCGDMKTAQIIYDWLRDFQEEFKTPLQISINEE